MKLAKTLAAFAIATASVGSALAAEEAAPAAVTGATAATTMEAPAADAASGTSVSLNVEGAPAVVSTTANSVTLQWNKVEAAVSYIVKYSEKSVATSAEPNPVYDNETAPVTETGATVEGLTEGKTYYFAVVALDKDGNESDSLSEELAVILSAPVTASGTSAGFALVAVTVKNTRSMTVEFSAPLGTDPIEVKLQKTANSATIPVESIVADPMNPTTATVTLAADLEGDSTYSLTVVSAKDAQGATIAEGVNAIKEFTTIAAIPPAVEVPLNAAAASGATASGATATGSLAAATEVPTGPKETLVIMLALLSGLGIVFALRRKAA